MLLNRSRYRYSEEADEDWMVSFADMVTLLLCFFILFFSEKKDDAKEDILREITTAFSPITKVDPSVKPSQDRPNEQSEILSNLDKNLKSNLNAVAGNNIDYELKALNSKEILLRVWSEGMFKSGSANLSPVGMNLVLGVAKTLSKYTGKIEIRIEGHTDSKNIKDGDKIRNNLVLSSLRAASTANVFLEDTNYFNEKDLVIIGQGSKNLLAEDKLDDKIQASKNADKNRRIDLYIITKAESTGAL